jgi:thymidylate synthase ThyX
MSAHEPEDLPAEAPVGPDSGARPQPRAGSGAEPDLSTVAQPERRSEIRPGQLPDELRVFDHGFVRLDASMADDLSVVNGARVSFAVRKEEMDARDEGLIKFLMRSGHGSPFEHNSFRFHIRCPIFVAREWFRHRVGCLTGDTRIRFVDTTGAAPRASSKTVDELWEMWSRGERNGHALSQRTAFEIERLADRGQSLRSIARESGAGRRAVTRHLREGTTAFRSARSRIRRMRLRVLNEDTNEFEVGHIRDVMDSGLQPVYRLTLADGTEISVTDNHRLLTARGWRTLREAVGLIGSGESAYMSRSCSVITNGQPVWTDHEWMKMQRSRGLRGCKLTGRQVLVIAVDYVGVRQTYDLSVEGPWHNFVANGIVVHNSFNEESARYHQLEGDFYVPSPQAVRTQVGKPGAYTFEALGEDVAADAIATFRRVYDQLYDEYRALVDKGVAKELARSLLPFGIYTQFYWTLNARSLMNFLALRNSPEAQYEIRVYAQAVERLFAAKMPVTHSCFEEFGRRVP